jgi:signal transduction histidine kinase
MPMGVSLRGLCEVLRYNRRPSQKVLSLVPERQFPDSRARRPQVLVLVTGGAVTALGSMVLIGWHLHSAALVQMLPGDAAMAYNTALCLVLAGVSVCAAALQRPMIALICGSAMTLVSVLTLSEYILHLDVGLDQALMPDDIELNMPSLDRMALATAIGLTLGGFATLLMSWPAHATTNGLHKTDIVGLLGTILLVIGVVSVLLSLTGMEVPYGWGRFAHSMATSTAAGFVLLGVGLVSWAWHRGQVTKMSEIRALPLFVQAAGVTATLLLWHALLVQEHQSMEATLASTASHIASEITARMEARVLALTRLAERVARVAPATQDDWTADAELVVRDFPGFQTIAWIDDARRVRWVAPLAGNEVLLEPVIMNEPAHRGLFERARAEQSIVISRPIELAQGGRGFVVYVPVTRGPDFLGVVSGGFQADTLFARILSGIAPGYALTISAGHEELYQRALSDAVMNAEWAQNRTINVFGARWEVHVWPQSATLDESYAHLPGWALGSGLIGATLFGLVVALAQESRRRARAADITNRELQRENSKRKEAELEVRLLNAELERRVQERTLALERANADLRQLAYVSAHDLQEPVRTVSTYTQLLARRYQGNLDAEADRFIAYTVEGATRMHALLTDLLIYLQIDQNDAEKTETDCEELFAAAFVSLQGLLTATAAQVTHDPLPTVRANATQLTLVFRHLLENALRFRLPQPPCVHVWAERYDDAWLFAVRDNGIGIEPQYAAQIFLMFERLHTQAEYPGTGMGLTLCHKIIERHGGHIWVESQLGQGATFYFTLPHLSLGP